jgi:hypothetical protein
MGRDFSAADALNRDDEAARHSQAIDGSAFM